MTLVARRHCRSRHRGEHEAERERDQRADRHEAEVGTFAVRDPLDLALLEAISRGEFVKFNTTDLPGLKAALESNEHFCRDHIGDAYHRFVEASTPCYREVVSNSPGLHLCIGGDVPSVHLDPTQVVLGCWPGYWCAYDPTAVGGHFEDLGWLP